RLAQRAFTHIWKQVHLPRLLDILDDLLPGVEGDQRCLIEVGRQVGPFGCREGDPPVEVRVHGRVVPELYVRTRDARSAGGRSGRASASRVTRPSGWRESNSPP